MTAPTPTITSCITLSLDEADGETAAARLMEEGIPFELRDQTTLLRPPLGRIELVLFVPPGEAASERERMAALLSVEGIAASFTSVEIDDSWRDAWKAYFRPRPVGPFVIVPSWEQYPPQPGEIILDLDPGRAFGTGGHASTRLCLGAIGQLVACERFLDVGCGSGILAVAAAKRWPAARGVAIDIDPEALEVTRENAERNGVAERIALPALALAEIDGRYDLVLANLTGPTLIELAGALAARIAPGGHLVASGFLDEESGRVGTALEAAGLRLEATSAEEEWRAHTLCRPA